ncbi:carbohydrate kinase [Caloramator sp. E03]|uniref:PfkB family carbohydrate kinase n=1 Tax=Caloramator sp. E03 TaxID=2576307 RepID=UPI0011106889|nr:PfkB family carbohydrate kinase [Caloramator sp. E03]QCX34396.1 carbohydrate kinase [Caloramator sp. E03]
MFDVAALGELLIDFTPAGVSNTGNDLFQKNPGGAPANVLVAVSRLGKKTAFVGMVGKDQFGFFLRDVLKDNGVDVSGLKFSENVNTTLAFVHLDKNGDRSFSFYRNPGADMMLKEEDLNYEVIDNSNIFHFGSISMTDEPSRSATLKAVEAAKNKGAIISYDPNLRPPLWKSLKDAKERIIEGLRYADILKVSDEEMEFITGTRDLQEGSSILYKMGIKLVLVTLGEDGCFYKYKKEIGKIDGFRVKVIDTTGAGDAFLGGVLYKICQKGICDISSIEKSEMEDIIRFANCVGALATTKKGAIPAMPTLNEVLDIMNFS